MDELRDLERQRYQFCRLGFGLMAYALIVATISSLLSLPGLLGRGMIPAIMRSPVWEWIHPTIPWTAFLGSFLLWGRWELTSWQRRAGLLLVLNLVDVILWFLDHGERLGITPVPFGHAWLRFNLGQAIGWSEFALMASLSSDTLVHLGIQSAAETGKSTRSLAATGASLWMILFLMRTNWRAGWPLGVRRGINLEIILLDLGTTLIWTMLLIQVGALCLAAARQCHEVLEEMAKEDEGRDLFPSPSDAGFGSLRPQGFDD